MRLGLNKLIILSIFSIKSGQQFAGMVYRVRMFFNVFAFIKRAITMYGIKALRKTGP